MSNMEESSKKIPLASTYLNVSLQKASQQITQRIRVGREIVNQQAPKRINTRFLNSLWDIIKKWDDYNSTLLKSIFSDETVADKYDSSVTYSEYKGLADYSKKINSFYRIKMRELESIKERLHLYKTVSQETSKTLERIDSFGNKVFIVHGHDETTKLSVARFLEKLDLNVIILHEQPNKGRTIIEKLEANSSEVDIGYAVVLLTPDDMGGTASNAAKTSSKLPLRHRARQNVVFELGYFIAKLGRERVAALYSEGVELPSDYQGVLYTKLDGSDSWKFELAREMKAAGIDLNLSKLL